MEFHKPMECSGQVENWLNTLTFQMQEAVRHKIGEATLAYEEMSREEWIFKFPAQVVLVVAQVECFLSILCVSPLLTQLTNNICPLIDLLDL